MRVLLTGADGFVGRHLRRELNEHGHEVVGFGWGATEHPKDLRGPDFEAVLEDEQPDVVVHAAALVGRENGDRDPYHTAGENAGITWRVAKACGEWGCRLLYLSSSEVYGEGVTSELVLQPRPLNLYGWSKWWGEQACRAAMPLELLQIARLSMPYGPGHSPGAGRAALTNFLFQAAQGEPIIVHAGGRRSWCWIGDTVAGLRLILEKGARDGTVYNVGRDDDLREMLAIAHLANAICGNRSLIQVVERPGGVTEIKDLPCTRLRDLGWAPKVELEQGMRLTLAWLARNYLPAGYDAAVNATC